MRALPRLAMIALGFTLHPPSPAAIGLVFLVALFWPCGPAPHPRPARHGWRVDELFVQSRSVAHASGVGVAVIVAQRGAAVRVG